MTLDSIQYKHIFNKHFPSPLFGLLYAEKETDLKVCKIIIFGFKIFDLLRAAYNFIGVTGIILAKCNEKCPGKFLKNI